MRVKRRKKPKKIITAIAKIEVPEACIEMQARSSAAYEYIYNEARKTIPEILQMPQFAHVNRRTMERWASLDRWSEKRKSFQENIRNRVEAALGTEITQARIAQLRKLMSIRESLHKVGMLTNEDGSVTFKSEPKSVESWIMALVRLDEHIDKLQTAVGSHLSTAIDTAMSPTERPTNLSMTLKPKLSEEEAYRLAKALTAMRMEEDAKRMAQHNADAEAKALPEGITEVKPPKKKKPPIA